MLKRFIDGLVFGSGFAVAFVTIWFVMLNFLMPFSFHDEPTYIPTEEAAIVKAENRVKFHELSDEDQIKNASALIIVRYQPSDDAKTLAIVEEVHKKSSDTILYYEVGDEYPGASFYPDESSRGQGSAILLIGSPAQERRSSSIFDKRIGAYGNMPVQTLISKFNEKNT